MCSDMIRHGCARTCAMLTVRQIQSEPPPTKFNAWHALPIPSTCAWAYDLLPRAVLDTHM
jgi:hypothetical protein